MGTRWGTWPLSGSASFEGHTQKQGGVFPLEGTWAQNRHFAAVLPRCHFPRWQSAGAGGSTPGLTPSAQPVRWPEPLPLSWAGGFSPLTAVETPRAGWAAVLSDSAALRQEEEPLCSGKEGGRESVNLSLHPPAAPRSPSETQASADLGGSRRPAGPPPRLSLVPPGRGRGGRAPSRPLRPRAPGPGPCPPSLGAQRVSLQAEGRGRASGGHSAGPSRGFCRSAVQHPAEVPELP